MHLTSRVSLVVWLTFSSRKFHFDEFVFAQCPRAILSIEFNCRQEISNLKTKLRHTPLEWFDKQWCRQLISTYLFIVSIKLDTIYIKIRTLNGKSWMEMYAYCSHRWWCDSTCLFGPRHSQTGQTILQLLNAPLNWKKKNNIEWNSKRNIIQIDWVSALDFDFDYWEIMDFIGIPVRESNTYNGIE